MIKKKKILKKEWLKLKEKRNSEFLEELFEFYNIKTTNKKGIWIKENDKLVKYNFKLEKLEDEEDYNLGVTRMLDPNNKPCGTMKELALEFGVDYDEL